MRRMRPLQSVILVSAVVSTLLVGMPGSQAAPEDKPKFVGSLSVGDSIFWNGPIVEDAGLDHPQYPVNVAEWYLRFAAGNVECDEICWRYEIEVAERADVLRLGLSSPIEKDMYDSFYFYIYDPRGEYWGYADGWVSQEAFIRHPEVGTWTVEVVPYSATNSTFRMRAKLENNKVAAQNAPRKLLAPNLRISPPTHFGFNTPPHWIAPWDDSYPYPSCTPDEVADDQSVSCMRLTVGIENVGLGPLELMYSSIVDQGATMYQRLNYSDGSDRMREAGTYEYHETHGHYHFAGFAKLDLFRVEDPDAGKLEYVEKGYKLGFCLGDTVIAEWDKFSQAPIYSARSDCDAPQQAWMGLSTGWTDLYGWFQAGNYVRWPGEDGYYVVRAMADALETLVETNEKDNYGYAFVKVEGNEVTVIERGRGTDPWDPNKVVIRDWWEKRLN